MTIIWLAVTIVAIIIEIVTVDLVSIWFGLGSLIALLASFIGIGQSIQIGLFVAISLICIIFTRPAAKKYLRSNTVNTNADQVIGEHALVTKRIDPDNRGEVKVLSQYWSATSEENTVLEVNDYCEVLAIDGAHLIVRKIEK